MQQEIITRTYVDEFITSGENATMSLKNIYDTKLVLDASNSSHVYRTTFDDFFLKHRDELKSIQTIWAVPQEMFYQPKMLSLQLYGTTELWVAILRANGMRNITEFHLPYVKVYDPDQLIDIMRVHFKRDNKI